MPVRVLFLFTCTGYISDQASWNISHLTDSCVGPQGKGLQESSLKLSKEEEALFDDDDLEDDELDALEAKLEKTKI